MTLKKMMMRKRVCLIMDEVDGMSSGDRGGMRELIGMIKKTQVSLSSGDMGETCLTRYS